jgi:hypothetical protein
MNLAKLVNLPRSSSSRRRAFAGMTPLCDFLDFESATRLLIFKSEPHRASKAIAPEHSRRQCACVQVHQTLRLPS